MSIKSVLFTFIIMTHAVTSYANEKLSIVTEVWSPYSYPLEDNSVGGIATNIVKEVMKQAKIDYSISIYPWARAYNLALQQPNTLIYAMYRNPERDDLFQWVCPLMPTPAQFLFALSENTEITINHLDDAKKYTIGATRNAYPTLYLQQNGFVAGKNLFLAANDDTSVVHLINHKVDLIIGSEARLNKTGPQNSQIKAVFSLDFHHELEICMALNLATPTAMVEKIRKALKQVNAQKLMLTTEH